MFFDMADNAMIKIADETNSHLTYPKWSKRRTFNYSSLSFSRIRHNLEILPVSNSLPFTLVLIQVCLWCTTVYLELGYLEFPAISSTFLPLLQINFIYLEQALKTTQWKKMVWRTKNNEYLILFKYKFRLITHILIVFKFSNRGTVLCF